MIYPRIFSIFTILSLVVCILSLIEHDFQSIWWVFGLLIITRAVLLRIFTNFFSAERKYIWVVDMSTKIVRSFWLTVAFNTLANPVVWDFIHSLWMNASWLYLIDRQASETWQEFLFITLVWYFCLLMPFFDFFALRMLTLILVGRRLTFWPWLRCSSVLLNRYICTFHQHIKTFFLYKLALFSNWFPALTTHVSGIEIWIFKRTNPANAFVLRTTNSNESLERVGSWAEHTTVLFLRVHGIGILKSYLKNSIKENKK